MPGFGRQNVNLAPAFCVNLRDLRDCFPQIAQIYAEPGGKSAINATILRQASAGKAFLRQTKCQSRVSLLRKSARSAGNLSKPGFGKQSANLAQAFCVNLRDLRETLFEICGKPFSGKNCQSRKSH